MAAQDKSIYEIFEIVSNNGQKTVDLVRGVISFSYYDIMKIIFVLLFLALFGPGKVFNLVISINLLSMTPQRTTRLKHNARVRVMATLSRRGWGSS